MQEEYLYDAQIHRFDCWSIDGFFAAELRLCRLDGQRSGTLSNSREASRRSSVRPARSRPDDRILRRSSTSCCDPSIEADPARNPEVARQPGSRTWPACSQGSRRTRNRRSLCRLLRAVVRRKPTCDRQASGVKSASDPLLHNSSPPGTNAGIRHVKSPPVTLGRIRKPVPLCRLDLQVSGARAERGVHARKGLAAVR